MLPPLSLTLGDTAGVGPEIVGKAWALRNEHLHFRRFSRSAMSAPSAVSGMARSRACDDARRSCCGI